MVVGSGFGRFLSAVAVSCAIALSASAGTAIAIPPLGSTPEDCSRGSFNLRGICWQPYADTSPFNQRLPADPPLSPDSSLTVDRLVGFWEGPDGGGHEPGFGAGQGGTRDDWDHPVYFSHWDDPTYTIRCVEEWGTCDIEGMEVRIPASARPAGGGDGHMTVLDLGSGWEYDFWQVRDKPYDGGEIAISWGGRTRINGDGLGSNATAAHFGGAAGIIRPAELAVGKIDHALFMVVKCTNGESVPPAGSGSGTACSDIGLPNEGAPPMGARFFLDMTDAEIASAPVPVWKKTVMRAAARYGLIVGDTGGGFIKLESGTTYTSFGLPDPWVELAEDAGLEPWQDSTGRNRYEFDLTEGIYWAGRLRMAAP